MRGRFLEEAILTVLVTCSASPAFGGTVELGRARVRPGQQATVRVTYTADAPLVAVSTDVTFDAAALGNPMCESGAALALGVKSVRCAELQRGKLRVAVLGLNVEPVPEGELVRVTFDVPATAAPRRYWLRQRAAGADVQGRESGLGRKPGIVEIVPP